MTWIIARCPETHDDVAGVYTSYTQSTLTDNGKRQAQELAGVLRRVHEIWSSPSQSSVQASLIVAADKDIICIDGLREVGIGQLEGLLPSKVEKRMSEFYLSFNPEGTIGDETTHSGNFITTNFQKIQGLRQYDLRLMCSGSRNEFVAVMDLEDITSIEARVRKIVQDYKQISFGQRVLTLTHPLLAAYLVEAALYDTVGVNVKRVSEKRGFFPLNTGQVAILHFRNGRVTNTAFHVPYREVDRYL